MAYPKQTFSANIAPYGETPYTKEDLDAAEETKRKKEAVVDTSNPYAQTYRELSGEERPKVEEAAAGKSISGRYFPQNVLDQEVLNKENAAKKRQLVMQLRSNGVSASAAEKMADDHLEIDNETKRIELEGTMLKAGEAKNALAKRNSDLTEQARLNSMVEKLNSVDPENIRDAINQITAIDHDSTALFLSQNPATSSKAQEAIKNAYQLAKDHRDAAERNKANLGSSKMYYDEKGRANYPMLTKEGAFEQEQRRAEEFASKVKEAGAIQEARTNVMEEARQRDIQLRADLARQAAAEKEAAKQTTKTFIANNFGQQNANAFASVWGVLPEEGESVKTIGSIKIKIDPKDPSKVLASSPVIAKGKWMPFPIDKWNKDFKKEQSATETTEDTKESEKTLTDDELVAKYK